MTSLWLLATALVHVILPAAYVSLCFIMWRRRVWWFTYVAYFCIFGSMGAAALMVELGGLGPAPIFTVPAVGSGLFLCTAGVSSCVISATVMQFRKNRGPFDFGALIGSYGFLVVHSIFVIGLIFGMYGGA